MLDPEDSPDAVVGLAAGREAAEYAHQREPRDAGSVGGRFPHLRLVDERLADVEDDRLYSHERTRSRSDGVVTLSRRSSPSTVVIRPPAASTIDAQSVPSRPTNARPKA